jgi:ABC-type branched-subunit amino acid transport system ATPase component/branched-subunit amino acid ABC-type transport system permease component
MTLWWQYGILGLGAGAAYVLLAQGILLIYRGSGVVNFAHGGFAMLGAYIYNVELRGNHGLGVLPAMLISVAVIGLLAGLVHPLIMRPLRSAAPLTRVIATLGVLLVLQAVATLRWGSASESVLPVLPQNPIHITSGIVLSEDRLIIVVIAIAVTAGLYAFSKYATAGLAIRAAAENQRAASSLAWSPDMLAFATWSFGGALAAFAGILITPYSGLDINTLTLVVISAMAAALLGSFRSFPVVLAGGLAIGVIRSLLVGPIGTYFQQQGSPDAVPFLLILVVLVVRGRNLPIRGTIVDRLPELGTGRVRPVPLLAGVALVAVLVLGVFSAATNVGVGLSVMAAIVMLSVVVLTGYAGQLSLAPFTLAGVGALVSARVAVAAWHWPFPAALLAGIVAAACVGVVFALPALRTRGVNLAVITLGLGLAIQSVIFENTSYGGNVTGIQVGVPRFFGLDLDPIAHPGNYALFAFACFVVVALLLCNLRRGRAGRRLLAVRANERAAAALGVNITGAKIYAFALSSAIAGLGGTLLAFRSPNVFVGTGYDPIASVTSVGLAVAGGVGAVAGPLFGGLLQDGGIGSVIADHIGNIDAWVPLIGGLSLIAVLLTNPDGQAAVASATARKLRARLAGRRPGQRETTVPPARRQVDRVRPRALAVRGLTVRFGGVVALDGVDLDVAPGQVIGLMGPNGAGKTTFIDAVSGFVRPQAGTVILGDRNLAGLPAFRRTRAGLSRSFQALELFDDVTVEENVRAAADAHDARAYATGLLWHRDEELTAASAAALTTLGLEHDLGKHPTELSYGRRRLVAIARAVAAHPSVLMLDEPGAGLDENETNELGLLVRHLADEWGIAILLIEHDVQMLLRTCDRIVVLDFGRKIAEGTPAVIRADPEVRRAYLGDAEVIEGETRLDLDHAHGRGDTASQATTASAS